VNPDNRQFDDLDQQIAAVFGSVKPPAELRAGIRTGIQRVQRRRRLMGGTAVVALLALCVTSIFLLNRDAITVEPMIADGREAGDIVPTPGSTDRPLEDESPARIRFSNPRDYIVVQPETKNPNISVFMIYEAENVTADSGENDGPQSSLLQQEPGA